MATHKFKFVLISLMIAACNGGNDLRVVATDSGDSSHESGTDGANSHSQRAVTYSTVADDIWPPQPVGVTNVNPYNNPAPVNSTREVKSADATLMALQDPAVLALIGDRYAITGQRVNVSKGQQSSTAEIEIFSYTNNQIVTVTSDAGQSIRTLVQRASDYQPAETKEEVAGAVSLAANHLQQLGYSTENLIGTGLLTHPSKEEFQRTGNLFYEHRMIYVTFGKGSGTTPLYRATVNLSTGTVSDAEPL